MHTIACNHATGLRLFYTGGNFDSRPYGLSRNGCVIARYHFWENAREDYRKRAGFDQDWNPIPTERERAESRAMLARVSPWALFVNAADLAIS